MSRSGYSDDYGHVWLWMRSVENAINGKRGQTFLRELVQSLEEMPRKRLITGNLILGEEVCALGAIGKKRGLDMGDLDPEEPEPVADKFKIATCLAQEIVYQNDERGGGMETPEARWTRIHSWATSKLKET